MLKLVAVVLRCLSPEGEMVVSHWREREGGGEVILIFDFFFLLFVRILSVILIFNFGVHLVDLLGF